MSARDAAPPTAPGSRNLGAFAIFGAKLYFLVVSMALGFTLINQLTPEQYGAYFLVNDAASLIGTVLVAGVIQSMSRHVARFPHRVHDVRSAGLRILGRLGLLAALLLAALAWPIAHLLGDDSLAPLLLTVTPIPLCYALYAVHVGIFNGRRQFGLQAGFDMGFASVKAGLMIAAAVLGYGAFGVLGAFAATTVMVLGVATPFSRGGAPVAPFPGRTLLAFSLVTFAYVFAINGVLRADTWLVKRGFDDVSVGLYGVALQVARIPYQLSVAFALVMFPFLAARKEDEQDGQLGALVERALRYGLVLAGAATAVLVGCGAEFLFVLDPAKSSAAALLFVVGPAMLAYTLTYLGCTVLVSRGEPGRAVAVAAFTLVMVVGLVRLGIARPVVALVPGATTLPGALIGAGQGVLLANLLGVAATAFAVRRLTGTTFGWRFAAALGITAAVVFAGANWAPAGDVSTLPVSARGSVAAWLVVKVLVLAVGGLLAFVGLRVTPLTEAKALLRRSPD